MSNINPLPQSNPTNFSALVYKEGTTILPQAGLVRRMSCNFQYMGVFGINMTGKEVPVPTTTSLPLDGQKDFQTANVLIAIGNVWVNKAQFGGPNFHVVVKVKDMDSGIVSYVDAVSFNANVVQCNPGVPVTGTCPLFLVNQINVNTVTATSVTVLLVYPTGAIGAEWLVNTSPAQPVMSDGTYADRGTTSVTDATLTTGTIYYFHIRTICGAGFRSGWATVTFTTP